MQTLFRECDKLENIINNFHSIRMQNPNKAYPGTVKNLKKLKQKFHLGLLSSAGKHLAHKDLIDCGIGIETFSYIQTEDDTAVHKPDPQVFKPIINHFIKLNINPEQMLYVGDTYNDYLAASGAGLDFVGIPRIEMEKEKMIANQVKIISKLADLPDML